MSDKDDKPISGKNAMAEYYSDLLGGDSLFDAVDTPSGDRSEKPASSLEGAPSKDTPATWSELSQKVAEAKSPKPSALPLSEERELVIPKPAPLAVTIPKPAPEEVESKPVPKPETKPVESVQPPETETKVEVKTEVSEQVDTKSVAQSSPEPLRDTPKPEPKSWTERAVDCLLFKVNGLTLAVPLEMLGSVHKLDAEITPLFGSANWFLGIFMVGEEKLNLLDTTRWVMPERYSQDVIENYRFAIRLGKSNWAVACDEIGQAIQVAPDQVKWRTERGKRSWLAGTVIDHMCGLLDAENLLSDMEAETAKHKFLRS